MRHYFAYTNYLARNSYETAVISEHLAMHAGKDNAGLAQEAAYMAVGAYVQAFNENEKAGRVADQEIDIARMERMAKLLTTKWPNSDRAMDARLQMGNVYATFKKYDQAASWLQQVPESSGKYIDAQQQLAKAQAEIKVVQANAEAAAITARGNAEASAIKARGEALRQSPELVALTAAEKWNGVLPTTMVPGGAVPFVAVPTNR